jgi:hypothetical protein
VNPAQDGRAKTTKVLEENVSANCLHDAELGDSFSKYATKTKQSK